MRDLSQQENGSFVRVARDAALRGRRLAANGKVFCNYENTFLNMVVNLQYKLPWG